MIFIEIFYLPARSRQAKEPERSKIVPQPKAFYSFPLYFLASALLHLALWLLIQQVSPSEGRGPSSVEVAIVYPDIQNTLVSQQDFNHQKPKGPAYLSRHNQVVHQQTQAMFKGLFHQAEEPLLQPPASRALASSSGEREERGFLLKKPAASEEGLFPGGISAGSSSWRVTKQTGPHSQTTDFLLGVEYGSHTLLNTKEFIYASYYNRMKEQLYWSWSRYLKAEDHLFVQISQKQGRGRKSFFVTRVLALLSPEGDVQDVQVVSSSGEEDLDTAALHAFLEAEPFPNPPPELVGAEGHIPIRKSFYIYVSPPVVQNLPPFFRRTL